MTATAAKKRSKKAKDEESQGQAMKAMEETAPPSSVEEKYRATPLATLPLTASEVKKLMGQEFENIGALEDFSAENGADTLKLTDAELDHIVSLFAMRHEELASEVPEGDSVDQQIEVDEPIPYKLPETVSDVEVENFLEEHRKAKAFDEIATLNTEASKAFDLWKRADEIAKGRKKDYEAAVNELRDLIDKTAHPEAMPLFDKKPEADGDKTAHPEAMPLFDKKPEADGDDEPTKEVNPPDESWRDIPLRKAMPELTESVHLKLEGAQLYTFGELANWTAENGGRRRLTDIAGIGSGTAGKIEEATMAFWQRWKPSANGVPDDNAKVQAGFAARRKFLDTKFSDLNIGDGPRMLLESAKLTTVGELEMSASLASIGIFDKLKSLGMDEAEATAVIEKLNAENARLAEERVVAAFAAMRVIYRNSVFAATAEGGGK